MSNTKDKGTPLQVWIPTETHQLFKMLCALRGKKMTETATNIISEWIAKESGQLKEWQKAALKDKE